MRLFLDANVIFAAAHNPDGNARALFKLAAMSAVTLTASRYAIDEAVRNFALKFPNDAADLESLLSKLEVTPEPAPAAVALARDVGLPDKDAPILAAAISARANMLVTGDRRDFGRLYGQTIRSVRVIPPAAAVGILLDRIS